jgi:hypothetical protein
MRAKRLVAWMAAGPVILLAGCCSWCRLLPSPRLCAACLLSDAGRLPTACRRSSRNMEPEL